MTQRAFDPLYNGFGIEIANWYSRTADLILRGQSGYNSRWILQGIESIVGSYKPDLCILFLGNNDATKKGQNVPPEEFKENVVKIINYLHQVNSDMDVILLTPTRADESVRRHDTTKLYVDEIWSILSSNLDNSGHIAVGDLWSGENSITLSDLCDSCHLNINGNRKVAMEIKETIRKHFPHLIPFHDECITPSSSEKEVNDIKLKYLFPPWTELAGRSQEETRLIINNCLNN